MINTIFYFANNLDYQDYLDKLNITKEIDNRTIVFSKNNKSIFAHGVQYCPMTPEELKEIIQSLLGNGGDLVLPAATKDVRGAIRVGEGLSMGKDNDYDVLNVDFSKVNNIDDLVTLIRRLFDSAEALRADKDSFGIVKLGEGLSIGSEGLLNVDFTDIPNNADIYASYNRYGVVKIDPKGGIAVTNDGIISVDSSKFPDNMKGEDGKSAYQIAVENGFEGDVDDWLNSLKGKDGANGRDGRDGRDGVDGRNGTDGQNGRDGSDGTGGVQKMYFLNIAHETSVNTPSIGDFLGSIANSTDRFEVNGQVWSNTNQNPSSGQDTWAIWVLFVNNTPQTILGPVRIYNSATNSSNGEDGEEIEWIYTRSTIKLSDLAIGDLTRALSEYSGNSKITTSVNIGGVDWYNHPSGVDSTYIYEYASYRLSTNDANGNKVWGQIGFSAPIIWSHFGVNGIDGDGVEYIYYVDTVIPIGSQDPSSWEAVLTEEYKGPDGSLWRDDPIDLLSQGLKEWVSVRKKQNGLWGRFSAPALWAYYSIDGVVDGYTVDLTNENMPVGTDSSGNVTSFLNTCGIQVYHNAAQCTYISSGTPTGNEFTANIEPIRRSDGASVGQTITANITNGIVNVSMQNVSNFDATNAYIPVTITLPDGNGGTIQRELTITLFGIAVGEAGSAIDLNTSASVIRTSYEGSNCVPSVLKVSVKVSSSSGLNLYAANSTWASNHHFTFGYYYDNDSNSPTSLSNTDEISISSNHSSITVNMYYNNTLVDSETIPYVADGAPGINGASPIIYRIDVLSTTLKAYQDSSSWKCDGSVSFRIYKTANGTTSEFTSINVGEDNVHVKIAGSTNTPTYSDSKFTSSISNVSYIPGTTEPFALIWITNGSNTVVVSSVVPFIIKGEKGDSTTASVQPIDGTVMRFLNWNDLSNGTNIYNGANGAAPDGVTYVDIILLDGVYYRLKLDISTPFTKSSSNGPIVSNALNSTYWIEFIPSEDTIYLNLIARQAFIQWLTSRQIVVTDGNNKPVAGLSSGLAIPYGNDADIRNNVRIWAGDPTTGGGAANLTNCPFYVTDTGVAHVEGYIDATSFRVINNGTPSIVFTTMSDDYRGVGFENLNSSGIANGEPIGIVYSGGSPKYFFSFTRLSSFSADPEVKYIITAGNVAGKVNIQTAPTLYYVTNSSDVNYQKYITTPSSNGTLANITTSNNMFERGTDYVTVKARSGGGWTRIQNIIYRQITITDGVKAYTGDGYIVSAYGTGYNIQTYTASSTTQIVNVADIYEEGGQTISGLYSFGASSYNISTCVESSSSNPESGLVIGIVTNETATAALEDAYVDFANGTVTAIQNP